MSCSPKQSWTRSIDTGVSLAVDAIHGDRLAILCGAGIFALPSARARQRSANYWGWPSTNMTRRTEQTARRFPPNWSKRSSFSTAIDSERSICGLTSITTLSPALRTPVTSAIADLLLVGGIQTAASTNVDTMIETAGMMLFGRIGAGIDGITVAALPPHRAPLLKIAVLGDRPDSYGVDSETTSCRADCQVASLQQDWLSVRLLDRDLVIVGYSTDWDYLNDVLARALARLDPLA